MTPKFRNTMVQLLFAGCLMLVIGGFVIIAQHNMAAQGITSGFSFLGRATGWDLGFSFLAYSIRDPYWWALWIGFLNTLFVGYFSILMATVLGLFVAMMRISGNPVLNTVSLAYVEIIRNVPPILQVLAWYALFAALPAPRQAIDAGGGVFLTARGIYVPMLNVHGGAIFAASIFVVLAIGALLWVGLGHRFMFVAIARKRATGLAIVVGLIVGIVALMALFRLPDTPLISVPALKGFNFTGGISISPELAAMLVATTVYGSAYVAEVFRGGFLSVSPGRVEAGRALGMSSGQILARIQLPLTVRNVLPMMTNLYVWLIKATTLGIAIGFSDLFMIVASSINQSGQTVELIILLAAGFWLINGAVVLVMNRINARMQRKH